MKWASAYLGVVAVFAMAQLALGCNVMLLGILFLISLIGLIPLTRPHPRTTDALYFVTVLYLAPLTLITKTILLQPAQQNLLSPTTSGLYLLIGSISMTIGYLASIYLSPRIPYTWRIERAFSSPDFLKSVAKPTFIIGMIFYVAHIILRPKAINGQIEDSGFGGFGSFYVILVLGLACQAGLCAARPKDKFQKQIIVLMSIVVIALSIAANVKKIFFDFGFLLIAIFFAYHLRIRLRYVFVGAVAALFLTFYIQPLIQASRLTTSTDSPIERFQAAWQIAEDANFDPWVLAEQSDKVSEGYKVFSEGYMYPSTSNTERFSMIFPTDEIVRNVSTVSPMGIGDSLHEMVSTVLPSAVIDKSNTAVNDIMAWHYGFRDNGSISRPVIGLIASSIAIWGLLGVIILPAFTIYISYFCLNCVSGHLKSSVWAIFMLVACIQLAEKEFASTIEFFPRQMIIMLGYGYLMLWFYGRESKNRRATWKPSPRSALTERHIAVEKGPR